MAAVTETITKFTFFILFILIFLSFIPTHQLHPLDPLTPSELDQVGAIVTTSMPNSSFHYVGLNEPDKRAVISWLVCGPSPPRRSLVVIGVNQATHDTVVDLSNNSVVSDKVYEGHGFPLLTLGEQTAAIDLVWKHPPFVAAVEKRGLSIEEIVCGSFTMGWYGWRSSGDKKAVRVMCYSFESAVNVYMRPVEGVTATTDLDLMELFRDRLVVPVPKASGTDYRESEQKLPFGPRVKGIAMVRPNCPSFTIERHSIR